LKCVESCCLLCDRAGLPSRRRRTGLRIVSVLTAYAQTDRVANLALQLGIASSAEEGIFGDIAWYILPGHVVLFSKTAKPEPWHLHLCELTATHNLDGAIFALEVIGKVTHDYLLMAFATCMNWLLCSCTSHL
jgi:hypothetical protein